MTDTRKLVQKGECKNCGCCCIGCDHYSEEIVNGGHCRIYPERSEGCRAYPAHFVHLINDDCGFQFFDAETGERLYARPIGKPTRSWTDDELIELCFYGYELIGGIIWG